MTNKPQQNAEEIEISPQLAPLGVVEIRAEYGARVEQHARPVNLPDEPTAREVVTGVTIVPYWKNMACLRDGWSSRPLTRPRPSSSPRPTEACRSNAVPTLPKW